MDQAIESCLAVPLWARSDEQLEGFLDAVVVAKQRLAAVELRLVREVDARGLARQQGACDTTAWLRDRPRERCR